MYYDEIDIFYNSYLHDHSTNLLLNQASFPKDSFWLANMPINISNTIIRQKAFKLSDCCLRKCIFHYTDSVKKQQLLSIVWTNPFSTEYMYTYVTSIIHICFSHDRWGQRNSATGCWFCITAHNDCCFFNTTSYFIHFTCHSLRKNKKNTILIIHKELYNHYLSISLIFLTHKMTFYCLFWLSSRGLKN